MPFYATFSKQKDYRVKSSFNNLNIYYYEKNRTVNSLPPDSPFYRM